MDPCAKIDYGRELVSIQLLVDWQESVHLRDQGLELFLETGQFFGDFDRVNAIDRANSYLNALETWFPTKCAHITTIRNLQAFHHPALPMPCRFECWDFPLFRCADDFLEDLPQVLPQPGAVFIPLRHGEARGSCPAPGRPAGTARRRIVLLPACLRADRRGGLRLPQTRRWHA